MDTLTRTHALTLTAHARPLSIGRTMSLLTELQDAGLNVVEYPGWETLTNNYPDTDIPRDRDETVGIVNHWDAIQGWPGVHKYTHDNRFGGLLYHIVVRQDGIIALLSQRYAWHAGVGDRAVLEALRRGEVPPYPTDRYDSDGRATTPVNTGNSRTFGVCINYYPPGDIPAEQYASLVRVNAVLLKHFNLKPEQIIDHDHWTTRKWDIRTMDLDQFRVDVEATRGALMFTPEEATELKQMIAEVKALDSDLSGAIREAIKLIRRERQTRLHSHDSGDTAFDPTARAKADAAHKRIDKIHDAAA